MAHNFFKNLTEVSPTSFLLDALIVLKRRFGSGLAAPRRCLNLLPQGVYLIGARPRKATGAQICGVWITF